MFQIIKDPSEKWVEIKMLQNGYVMMESKAKISITFGAHMAFFLGWTDIIRHEYATITLEETHKRISPYPRQDIPLFTNFMFLYSNCIKPLLIAGGFRRC